MGFGYGGSTQYRTRERMERLAPKKQRKYTFGTHAQTAHVWAQQNEETQVGQSSDGRVYFEGARIYSFGSHFILAEFSKLKDRDGRQVVFFNADSYSVSTSSHQGYVRGALRGLADVHVLTIPKLTEFSNGSLFGKDRAAYVRGLWESALESIARADKELAEHQPDADGVWRLEHRTRGAAEAREHLELLRDVFKITAKVPRDVVAWYDARKAKQARDAINAKVGHARDIVAKIPNALPAIYMPDATIESAYAAGQKISGIDRDLSKVQCARHALARAKRFPRLVKRCSEAIKYMKQARADWAKIQRTLAYAETRDRDLAALATLETFFQTPSEAEPQALQSTKTAAYYWACAIREDKPELAERLARIVHASQFRAEVAWRVPPRVHTREKVTAEQWQAGQGDSYWNDYSFTGPTLLRKKGDVLQTSRGADCPWKHAVGAFMMAQHCRATSTVHVPNGHTIKVGHFKVDKIEADGTLRAGCHTLEFDEMTRLAVKEVPQIVRACYPLPALI